MDYGYFRVATCSPELKVCDVDFNTECIIAAISEAKKSHVQFLVFPEFSLTGYTCGELFLQKTLRNSVYSSIEKICNATKNSGILVAVGLPFEKDGSIYNCAAFIHCGQLVAIVPKTFIPNYGEFYERRWFSPFSSDKVEYVNFGSLFEAVPFGTNILIEDENLSTVKIACELCEDLWVTQSPCISHSLHGATIIANLSASNEVVGKADYRRLLVSSTSARTLTAYIYSNAGHDESTTDCVFSGHSMIACNGKICAESKLFDNAGKLLIADIDTEILEQERVRTSTFSQGKNLFADKSYVSVFVDFDTYDYEAGESVLSFKYDRFPFVPSDSSKRKERCEAVVEMQSEGLAKRIRHINCQSAVIGLSGGLDSTLALLVTARAFDKCGIDRKKILCVTLPAFGTTDRTYNNACSLAKLMGAELKEINIKESVLLHFRDIGHDEKIHDVTYENGQARERTQILMNLANKTNGIVIGTGDLSELALGWCTYNGDHMSMYGVNSSIPKTLVRYLVQWFAEGEVKDVLEDILDTPVSPELLPPEDGKISQKTEELVGPYELHDFFLYYVLRWGYSPKKIYYMALNAFDGIYSKDVVLKWLKNFYRRFFTQQFKRSCMPDGAKVGTVNLSPRGDWRMPSDACSALWLKEVDDLC